MSACLTCVCPLIPQAEWGQADSSQRKLWTAAGVRMLQGRGLCRACYLRAHRRGEFPVRSDGVAAPAVLCSRCGQSSGGPLCVDCTDVLTDMHELERWAS